MPQCTAKSKRTGERCRRQATPGRTVCAIHGGKTPRGTASPHFRHGRYSKAAPVHIRQRYEDGLNDETLLALDHEIALLDSRTQDILSGLNGAAIGEMWLELRAAYQAMLEASRSQNFGAGQEAFETIGRIITQGATDFESWMQIGALVEQRRKLVDTETKRRIAAGQMLTAEEAMILVAQLEDTIQRRLGDQPQLLFEIQTDFVRILDRAPRREYLAAGDDDARD